MNICILISSLNYGGSSQVAVDLACSLKKRGHSVTVVTLWNLNFHKYAEILNSKSIELKTCNKKSKFDFLCYKRLKQILNKGKFDLINTHLTSLFYCFLAKPNQRVVHTIHSVPNLDIPKSYRFLMKRWLLKHNVVFVGCSVDIKDKAVCIYKKQQIELITNGFDLPDTEKTKKPVKEYDFIYVGRLVSMKNIDEIIKAFSLLKNDGNKLCIVGDGPEKYNLEKLCSNNNIPNVHFAGGVDNVFDYLNKSRVFCLFSDFEGGPICLLEAMGCGLPVICSDIGGNRTYVKDRKNGLVFELHNVEDARTKMSMLLEDKTLYGKMSKGAFETAKENCIDNMVDKYESLFVRLINE